MNHLSFLIILACVVTVVVYNLLRAKAAANKIIANTDPLRVVLMQQEAISLGLQAIDGSGEPPEVIAERRDRLLRRKQEMSVMGSAY